MKRLSLAVLPLLCAAIAPAQVRRDIRASITGGGGDGKCTIEVNVDGIAMVEVSQDQGRLITESGQPSEWRRMQCNQRMPSNPYDFRFRGIDGRGNVSLVREPARNRGVAVIRIEDRQGGRESYTFDLEWRSGGDAGPVTGAPGEFGEGHDNGNGRGYGRGRGRDTYVVSCSSNGRRVYCEAETGGGVLMLRTHGGSECRQGHSWGYDKRGIWVDHGCRADFEVAR